MDYNDLFWLKYFGHPPEPETPKPEDSKRVEETPKRANKMPRHIHKYKKMDIGRRGEYWVMKCVLPRCNSYTPMRTEWSCPTLVGKEALCNRCGDPFLLDRRSLLRTSPTCEGCASPKKKKKLMEAEKFFEQLESELME